MLLLWAGACVAIYYAAGIQDEPHEIKQIVRVLLGIPALLLAAWTVGRLGRVLLAGLVLLVALAGAELVLRGQSGGQIGLQHLTRFDPARGWSFVPGQDVLVENRDYRVLVRINSAGFRDAEPAAGDTRPVTAVLGDSFTSNIGVELEECFTSLLDQWDPARSVRNFGVNGYGQVQELLLLRDLLADERIERVLLVLYVRNDFDDNLGTLDDPRRTARPHGVLNEDGSLRLDLQFAPPSPRRGLERIDDLLAASRVGALLRGAALRLRRGRREPRLRDQPPEWRYCRRTLGDTERTALRATELLLERAAKACRGAHVRFGVILAPTIWQVYPEKWTALIEGSGRDPEEFELARPQTEIAAWCAEARIPCLDLLPALRARAAAGEALYHPREQHWNALGNRRVAEAVRDWRE